MRSGTPSTRRVYHVARADFLQRIRSRRLLTVLAVIAYLGYLVNIGTIEIFYQDSSNEQLYQYAGEPTSAYIGLTAGVTGAAILFLAGYYVLSGSLERDRETGVERLVGSTSTTARELLLGKWCSHVGLVVVLLGTLGTAALLNHLVHGTGPTDPLWILGPVFLLGLPVGCFVAGVTLLFQSTHWLRGTLGNAVYFFGAVTLMIAAVPAMGDRAPGEIPLWARMTDTIGLFALGELTYDAVLEVGPGYDGSGVANFGMGSTGAEVVRFHWTGDSWPLWFYANRLGLVLLGIAIALAASLPYDRFSTADVSDSRGLIDRLSSAVPSLRSTLLAGGNTDDERPAEPTLTPVTDRSAGGFGRLVHQEFRLLVRGQPWWWYVGAFLIGLVGLTGSAPTGAIVSAAAVWPIFLWSSMGVRTLRHQMTPFIVSSRQPYGQLLAEWTAGAIVTAAFLGVALWPVVFETGVSGLVVLLGGILFVPSLAQAMGFWSRTRRLFELTFLLCWYLGPLNQVPVLDFAGATGETAGTATPLLFGAVGLLAFLAAVGYRHRQT
ncbi:hypothetical protein EL22_11760 [Halostagnicola sp. A56]|uniref:ABC transporter permease n=1 Tax=Halostagnicola sp. A56 TaxID=1495067 RepID=UPI00049EC949|nr:hypothetical protein [Halostagnicola sp. A56]KDE60076.1 hypothetical protein EL22_11760 [Halostagnicola sp. A56]